MIECKICGKVLQRITNHIKTHKISTKEYYDKYLKTEGDGICKNCGGSTNFIEITKGYQQYCSKKCFNSSDIVREKRKRAYDDPEKVKAIQKKTKKTNLERYGVENPFQSEEIKDKIKKTVRLKYDVDNPAQSKEIQEKTKETNQKRFGCDSPAQSDEVKDKMKKIMLDRYGVENPSQLKEVKEKKKQTCLDNHGVEYPMQSEEVRERANQTCLNRYGVSNISKSPIHKKNLKNIFLERFGGYPLQNKDIREKSKQTCLKNYGVEYPLQSEKCCQKFRDTSIKRFGVDHPFKNKEVQDKYKHTLYDKYGVIHPLSSNEIYKRFKDTSIKRFGVDHPFKNKEVQDKCKTTRKINFFELLMNSDRIKDVCTPNFTIDDYQGVDYKYSWNCTKCENVFDDHLDDGHIPRCPKCYPKLVGISKGEKEVSDFIISLEIDIETNCYHIIPPKELDIYISSHNLAIEFDGVYWHSELNGKDKTYHISKTLQCKEKGIQLIHIFEDEWIDKQEIVKSIIRAKLGLIQNKIYARKCEIQSVSNEEAKLFLFDNHLQGPINGTHIGLYYENELVSLITYGKSRFSNTEECEILRFCNKINASTIGGLSKLLKQIDSKSIITYADLRFGEGLSYLKCGFEYIGRSSPSYFYIRNGSRINRLNFQKHLLQDKLDIFDPTLTEWQNMQLNGYDRIWDCGVVKYTLINM